MILMGVVLTPMEAPSERIPPAPTLRLMCVSTTGQAWSPEQVPVSRPRHLADLVLSVVPGLREVRVTATLLRSGGSPHITLTVSGSTGSQNCGFHFLLDEPHEPEIEARDLWTFFTLTQQELLRRMVHAHNQAKGAQGSGEGGSDVQP